MIMEKLIIVVIKKLGDSVSVTDYRLQDDKTYKSTDGTDINTLDEESFVKLYVENNVADLIDYWGTEFWLDNSLLNNIVIDTLGYRKHGKFTSVTDILKAKHANK